MRKGATNVITLKDDLNAHKQQSHKDKEYTCEECDYKAATKADLNLHIDRSHEDITSTQNMIMDSRARRDKQDSTCEKCKFNTTSAAILKQHMKNCIKETKIIIKSKRIQCLKCDKKFNKESTHKTHMKAVHNESTSEDKVENTQQNMKLTLHERTRSLRSYKTLSGALESNS